jgi:hypothetical protein
LQIEDATGELIVDNQKRHQLSDARWWINEICIVLEQDLPAMGIDDNRAFVVGFFRNKGRDNPACY